MPLDEISQQGIAEACKVIGCHCHSLDHVTTRDEFRQLKRQSRQD